MRIRRRSAVHGWLLAAALLIPGWVQAQETPAPADPTAVLKTIPAEAAAFVAVRSLKELDADILAIAQQLQLPIGPNGMWPGPLEYLKLETGVGKGLHEEGSTALVLLNCRNIKSSEEMTSRLVLLIPCTDAAALAESLKGEKDGDMYKLTLMGEESVAAAKDGFLVVAEAPEPVKEVLQAKGGGVLTALAPDRVKAFREHDLFVWVNLGGFSKEVVEEAGEAVAGLMAMMGQPAAEDAGEQISKFVEQSKELSLGLSLDPKKGLGVNFCFRAKEDSELGRQMAGTKVPDGSLLMGLPNEPAVFSMGAVSSGTDPQEMRTGMEQALGRLPVEEIDPAQIKQLIDSLVKLGGLIEQASASISHLPKENEEGLLGIAIVAKAKDGQEALAEFRKLFTVGKELVLKFAAGVTTDKDKVQAAGEAVQWKENTEQIQGVAVDVLSVNLEKIPNTQAKDIEQVKQVVGKEGVVIRVARADDKHLVAVFGGGPKRFARIIEHVRKAEAPLAESKEVKKVAGLLPAKERIAELYFNVDHLLALITEIATIGGQPLPMPLVLKNAAPIAMTVTKVDGAAQQVDFVVPMELVTSVKEVVMPMIGMMMMGGGQTPGMEMEEEKDEPEAAPAPPGSELK